MTDKWMEELYAKAGQDMWQAMIDRLLSEFKFLGGSHESRQFGECGEHNVIDGRNDTE